MRESANTCKKPCRGQMPTGVILIIMIGISFILTAPFLTGCGGFKEAELKTFKVIDGQTGRAIFENIQALRHDNISGDCIQFIGRERNVVRTIDVPYGKRWLAVNQETWEYATGRPVRVETGSNGRTFLVPAQEEIEPSGEPYEALRLGRPSWVGSYDFRGRKHIVYIYEKDATAAFLVFKQHSAGPVHFRPAYESDAPLPGIILRKKRD